MNTFDSTWEDVHQKESWGKYPSEDVIRFMARNYYKLLSPLPPTPKVLDLGCGGGANTWYLAKEGFDTYAIDGSETAVIKTKNLLSSMNLHAAVTVNDASNLPFQDNFFDVIIDSALIYANMFDGINAICKECYRILKKGGSIFSTGNFSPETTGFGTGIKLEENTYKDITAGPLKGRGTTHFFTKDELLNLYKEMNEIKIDYLKRTDGDNIIAYHMVHAKK
jgi:ubiquinone/menaquinone biosynthesis C-methylase UbiE